MTPPRTRSRQDRVTGMLGSQPDRTRSPACSGVRGRWIADAAGSARTRMRRPWSAAARHTERCSADAGTRRHDGDDCASARFVVKWDL